MLPISELSPSECSVTGKPVLARVIPEISHPLVNPFERAEKTLEGKLVLIAGDEIVRQIERRKRARGARS